MIILGPHWHRSRSRLHAQPRYARNELRDPYGASWGGGVGLSAHRELGWTAPCYRLRLSVSDDDNRWSMADGDQRYVAADRLIDDGDGRPSKLGDRS